MPIKKETDARSASSAFYDYDPQKRALAKKYSRHRLLVGVLNGIVVELLALFVFLLLNLNVLLKESLSGLPTAVVVPAYAFSLILFLNAVKLPLSFYSGYIFEHKYGLSNYTVAGWFRDYLKRLLVGSVIGVITLTVVFYLWPANYWWIIAGIFYTLFSVLLNYLYPVVLVPFFYKFEPYQNRKHKQRLLAMCRYLGVSEIKDVIVVKESEKSKKPNAFFTGFGNAKKIALFDTLISGFTEDEIETVIAHELGHYANRDIWRGIAVDAIRIFPALFIIDRLLWSGVNYFGIPSFGDLSALPLFVLLFSLAELITMPITNTYSRYREGQADFFALNVVQKPEAQVSTEKRLADMSLGDDQPHPLVETVFWTHPATWRRVKMAQEWKRR